MTGARCADPAGPHQETVAESALAPQGGGSETERPKKRKRQKKRKTLKKRKRDRERERKKKKTETEKESQRAVALYHPGLSIESLGDANVQIAFTDPALWLWSLGVAHARI